MKEFQMLTPITCSYIGIIITVNALSDVRLKKNTRIIDIIHITLSDLYMHKIVVQAKKFHTYLHLKSSTDKQ